MHRFPLLCLALLVAGATCPRAQSAERLAAGPSAQRADEPRFTSGVELVALDVCVKDRNGRPATGLKLEDFLILDNNVPQRIALFSTSGRVPLAVALVIDTSHSMAGGRLDRAKVAAAKFIEMLRPDDLVEVLSFSDRANMEYALGLSHEQATRSLTELSASGMTGLYEAVLVALRDLERAPRHRTADYLNVMIVLSDGDDTRSRLGFDELIEQVRRSGVLIYTISLRDRNDRVEAPRWEMAKLAHDSGGEAVAIRDIRSLTRIYQEINAELVNLYRVGYVPSPATRDGSWRTISVRVPEPALVIRTRAGYYAPHPRSTTFHSSRR